MHLKSSDFEKGLALPIDLGERYVMSMEREGHDTAEIELFKIKGSYTRRSPLRSHDELLLHVYTWMCISMAEEANADFVGK